MALVVAVSIALNVPLFFRITITNATDDTQPNTTVTRSHRSQFEYTPLGKNFYFKVPYSTAPRPTIQLSRPPVALKNVGEEGAKLECNWGTVLARVVLLTRFCFNATVLYSVDYE